jgi:hypothetical protein
MSPGTLCVIDPPPGDVIDPEERAIIGAVVVTAAAVVRRARRYWTTLPPTCVTAGSYRGEVAVIEHWLRPLRGGAPTAVAAPRVPVDAGAG